VGKPALTQLTDPSISYKWLWQSKALL